MLLRVALLEVFAYTNFIYLSGLLTVDPSKRMTMKELLASSWLLNCDQQESIFLLTPSILSIRSFPRAAEMAVKQTFDAFHMAAREGFRLQVCVY